MLRLRPKEVPDRQGAALLAGTRCPSSPAPTAPEEHRAVSTSLGALRQEFFRQLEFCEYEIQTGPDKKMKWGVDNNTRDPHTGEIVHDDLVLSAALVAALDEQDWTLTGQSLIVQGIDPLLELDKGF